MTEVQPHSPDSGIGGFSPLENTKSFFETEKTKTLNESVLQSNMFAVSPSSLSNRTDRNSSLFTDLVLPQKPYWNSGEKSSSRSEKCRKITGVFGNNLKRKSYNRKRRMTKDSDDISPVLGIKILPAKHFKDSKNEEFKQPQLSTFDSSQNDFVCRLCFQPHDDALALATHKCVRIVNESYICPECGKNFANPANLASHRRWHKPKDEIIRNKNATDGDTNTKDDIFDAFLDEDIPVGLNEKMSAEKRNKLMKVPTEIKQNFQKAIFPCPHCKRRFRRSSNRRKHIQIKHNVKKASGSSKERAISSDEASEQKFHQVAQDDYDVDSECCQIPQSSEQIQEVDETTTTTALHQSAYLTSSPPCKSSTFPHTLSDVGPVVSVTYKGSEPSSSTEKARTSSSEQNQPLDLSVNKMTTEELPHGIDKILKTQQQPRFGSSFPLRPIMMAYPYSPLLRHNRILRLPLPNTLVPFVSNTSRAPYSIPVPFCRPNPFLTQIHWTYGTASQSSVSSNFSEKRK